MDYDADAYHVYHDVGLSFRVFGDTVREITLLNDSWIASNGLIVGMTRAQMFDISIEVYHSSDKVAEINIKEGNLR